ncbi:hypothetical protein FS749_007399 [Ceratobasidium sp. UAMH 11750]|nr:hypothetical protein FS749_007399 [Ceratobasidium sp. UAMH 11750]
MLYPPLAYVHTRSSAYPTPAGTLGPASIDPRNRAARFLATTSRRSWTVPGR